MKQQFASPKINWIIAEGDNPHYVQYRLSKNLSRQGADDKSCDWQAKS